MNFKRALMWQHRRLLNIVRIQGGFSYQPLAVSFTLTGACNLRCRMCSTRSQAAIFLDAALVSKTVDELARKWWWKRPVIHLIGGEPLLHRDFVSMLSHIQGRGFRPAITTNGYLLKQFAQPMIDHRVGHVTVSVDGPKELHDEIRGVAGSFARARDGVLYLKALPSSPTVAVNCTVTPDNQDRLFELARETERWGVDSLTIQHLVWDREARSLAEAVRPDHLSRELRRIRETNWRMPINIFPPIRDNDLPPYYRDLDHPFGSGCIVPWIVARVYPGAEVAPCLDLYQGSLADDPLWNIWNTEKWRRFRSFRRSGRMVEGCLRCCHRQYYG